MKLARLFLAAFSVCTLAACADSVTAPVAEPTAAPSANTECTLKKDASGAEYLECSPVIGSGG